MVHESRLKLARLLLDDMDPAVSWIVAQPFRMVSEVDGKQRSHVPDFLLTMADGSHVVVDVKPLRRLIDPEVRFTFEWAREMVAVCSWVSRCSLRPIRCCWATCGSSPATDGAGCLIRTGRDGGGSRRRRDESR